MGSVQPYQHIFHQHLLGLQHQGPQPKEAYELIWPSIFLLLCFLILVTVKVTSFAKVSRVVQSCFSMQTLRQLEREEYNPFKFYSVALSLFFILNLAFFIYKVNEAYGLVLTGYSKLLQFLFFLATTMLVFMVKNGLSRVLAIGIGDHRLIPEYSYSSFVISQTLGILLFPCLVFAELSHFNPLVFLSAASVILLAMQVFKWYRGIVFALIENRVGLLQIFTYFCSLEILPVLVLVKFIVEKF